MTRVLRALTAFSSFLLLLGAAEARAQDDDAQALELYEPGVATYEEGLYEEAALAFQSAARSEAPVEAGAAGADLRVGGHSPPTESPMRQ